MRAAAVSSCDATRTFSFACAKRGITAAASPSVRPSQRGAEQQRRREPVAGDVVAEVDHVARLLAAEHAALAPERLEHVAVADVGRDDADPALGHQLVEAVVRHLRDRDEVDAEVEREDRDDAVAVDELAALVDREHAVAVAVERDPEVEAAAARRAPAARPCRSRRSRR